MKFTQLQNNFYDLKPNISVYDESIMKATICFTTQCSFFNIIIRHFHLMTSRYLHCTKSYLDLITGISVLSYHIC